MYLNVLDRIGFEIYNRATASSRTVMTSCLPDIDIN